MNLLFILFCAVVQSVVAFSINEDSNKWNETGLFRQESRKSAEGLSGCQTGTAEQINVTSTFSPCKENSNAKNVTDAHLADEEDYLLLVFEYGEFVFVKANSMEVKASVSNPGVSYIKVAVVDNTIYAINPAWGEIMSTAVEKFMTAPKTAKWVKAGSFPGTGSLTMSNALVNGSFIYFLAPAGVLNQYDTITEKTIVVGKVKRNFGGGNHLDMINNIMYVYSGGYLSSFDGSTLEGIGIMDHCRNMFVNGTNICCIEYVNIPCYKPSYLSRPAVDLKHKSHSLSRMRTANIGSKLYVLNSKGRSYALEIYNTKTKSWSYIQNTLARDEDISFVVPFTLQKKELKKH